MAACLDGKTCVEVVRDAMKSILHAMAMCIHVVGAGPEHEIWQQDPS